MTPEEIKNTDFETFFQTVPQMKEVHHIKATGQEIYHVYKHDVVYVTRPEGERTLQMLVPEVKPESAQQKYPTILYVQGSAWLKQDQYKRLSAMADLARRGFVTAILQYRESDLAAFPAQIQDAKTGVRFLRKHAEEYQNVMRRFLKGDEGVVTDVMYQTRKRWDLEGIYNCITTHTGFTLKDLVSYDGKHNEANGENNQDGPDYNYSWNCGAEGLTRKKAVLELRKNQMRNAMFLLLLSQGVPCILAGDEFANSQKGNNNVYCQDNPIGWLNWRNLLKEQEMYQFVKQLIKFRKKYRLFHQEKELLGIDQSGCGMPDVSYHGEMAWRAPTEVASRQIGIYYSSQDKEEADCFVAYNMHWLEHEFALPALKKGRKWYRAASTKEGILKDLVVLENQRNIELDEREIVVLVSGKGETV